MKKNLGLIICLLIIFGATHHVGFNYYNDIMSLSFVVGGGFGFSLLKSKNLFIINLDKSCIFWVVRNFDWIDSINRWQVGKLGRY